MQKLIKLQNFDFKTLLVSQKLIEHFYLYLFYLSECVKSHFKKFKKKQKNWPLDKHFHSF